MPRQPLSLLDGRLPPMSREEPLSSRHHSFPVLDEEEDLSFVEAPFTLQSKDDDDSIFVAPEPPRRSFITNSRRSGRRSEPERSSSRITNGEAEKL